MWINSWVFKLYCFIKDTKTNCGEIYKTKYLEKGKKPVFLFTHKTNIRYNVFREWIPRQNDFRE